jgi:hypothetical protein
MCHAGALCQASYRAGQRETNRSKEKSTPIPPGKRIEGKVKFGEVMRSFLFAARYNKKLFPNFVPLFTSVTTPFRL